MLMVKTFVGPSVRDGLGLFAAQDIAPGTLVWHETPYSETVFGVDVVLSLEAESTSFVEQIRKYSYKSGEHYRLCNDDARFMNHDDDANTRMDGPARCVAVRAIAQGEEITSDYREYCEEERPLLAARAPR